VQLAKFEKFAPSKCSHFPVKFPAKNFHFKNVRKFNDRKMPRIFENEKIFRGGIDRKFHREN